MKNLKFGAFFLGLVVVVATLVTGVKAQSRDRNFMVSTVGSRAWRDGQRVDSKPPPGR